MRSFSLAHSSIRCVHISLCYKNVWCGVSYWGIEIKEPLAESKPQNPGLVDKVFSLFKGYLNNKLEEKEKLIEGQSKIQRSALEFKFKGNRKQSEVNAKL